MTRMHAHPPSQTDLHFLILHFCLSFTLSSVPSPSFPHSQASPTRSRLRSSIDNHLGIYSSRARALFSLTKMARSVLLTLGPPRFLFMFFRSADEEAVGMGMERSVISF